MKERLYTQSEVNRIFQHIPAKTLLYWIRQGLVPWSDEAQDGRGIHRKYRKVDLYALALVEELAALNLPLEVIRLVTKNGKNEFSEFSKIYASGNNILIIGKLSSGRTYSGYQIGSCSEDNLKEGMPNLGSAFLHIVVNLAVIFGQVNFHLERLKA